jgi:UDP-N-acetylglucosamine 4,6-dehydratase
VPLFIKMRASGKITITDERMTRFWLSLEQGVHFVINCIEQMEGGEVFVPKIPSTKVMDLARAIAPEAQVDIIGIRPGEKLHEDLLSEDEARNAVERETMYIIKPPETLWDRNHHYEGTCLPEGFSYTSDNNTQWLDVEGIRKYIEPFEQAFANGTLEG